MSNFVDPSKSMLWVDGDAFRAPAGTAPPVDVFASSLSGWEPFGGIQAGFNVARPREVTKHTIWNKRGIYRNRKGIEEPEIVFRPVEMSKATALTQLRGGSIVAAMGGYEWIEGEEEFFALIIRALDGTKKRAYYGKKVEVPVFPADVLNDENLGGYDLTVAALTPDDGSRPLRLITESNPLA